MDQLLNIRTPEHIELRYKLAGMGNRFLAFALDSLLLAGALAVLWIGVLIGAFSWLGGKDWQVVVVALAVCLSFLIYYGYFLPQDCQSRP